MFDVDDLVARCQETIRENEPHRAIREVLERVLARPEEVADVFDPREGGLTLLHNADDLTVLNVVWAPGMALYPHDHRMWAAIGIYTGQEDNAFYRRPTPDASTLAESGGRSLVTGDTIVLGTETIHGVVNPLRRLTGAIHVYGGDFVRQPRSQWGPGPREERPYDIEDARRQFSEANAAWAAEEGDPERLPGGVGDATGETIG